MYRILIIEDDIKIRQELCKLLGNYGYEPKYIKDFRNILEECLDLKADLILLDINLPYYDGFYICREIRKQSDVPIIVVTSRNTDMDELMSLNLGADDFINKPYNSNILIAHITAILKRTTVKNNTQTLHHKDLILNISNSTAIYKNSKTELTKNELNILSLLIRNKETIVSRDEIINELWQSDEFIDDNTLTVNVNRLRKKLEIIGLTNFIETKRGQGYII
ncbi:DNA-binding response regulator [Vallitalea longa]|uniref:Stage 0 sporulation protein A homolog n=1 Tax=Vallitalea longa TaxID=2936439 RepID=A0A9W5Y7V8_9FIRM|nr:response regulator transcription factor [Vallitalea longa]GKX28287.1 DNA-binding response regulator [Vallitalea longa]